MKSEKRLRRFFSRIERRLPATSKFMRWVTKPSARWVRIPLSIILIIGGLFSFIPGLGIWMGPLGLLFIAIDIPPMRDHVTGPLIRMQRWITLRWRKWKRKHK